MNHLANQTSPYLRQHADNPVDWYPWSDEALARAKTEAKPILLSIGYSACHWCHVMAHESFEDPATAAIMNESFINIKVDREERPDLDDIYMQAVQALTRGHGGWPMTVFLLPDGRPFYAGTYFPRDPHPGMPTFQQVMDAVLEAYNTRREDVEKMAEELTQGLQRDRLGIGGLASDLNVSLLDAAFENLTPSFDHVRGGSKGAPKFPQPMNLEFLLRTYTRTGSQEALDQVTLTLRQMARGGVYDQLGGGFHRYSVDAVWLVPHFEKMLYDNAQMSRVYLHAWQVTHEAFFRTIAEEIYDYILREMTAPEGGFYSTTDADSEHEEGKFFIWTRQELQDLLGDDARIAIEYWGVTARGNFDGSNILYVPNEDSVAAERLGLSIADLHTKLAAIKDKLYAARTQRVHPGLDDKTLTSWNGLMLASLSEAARVFKRADYHDAAVRCGEFLLDQMVSEDGKLWRTYKDGHAHINGYLEDYAALIEAFLQLYQTTFDERWFDQARTLADAVLKRFRAPDGGFFDTGDDHEALIARPRELQDNATPAGSSLIARGLLELTAYTGNPDYTDAAHASLRLLTAALREYPQAFGEALNAADMLINGLAEIAIVGSPDSEATQALIDVAQQLYRPNAITALAAQNVEGEANIPLLSYRVMRGGAPTVYVCRNFACQMPVTAPEAVMELLKQG